MNVYQIITDRILDLLEKGTIPWKKTWAGGNQAPTNLISKKKYRGVNVFMLASMSYESQYWLTFNQARILGGSVKKSEKATPVIFYKWLDHKMTPGKKVPLLRYYHVFNIGQCDGLEEKVPAVDIEEHEFTPIQAAETLIEDMPRRPQIVHKQARAFYRPDKDLVNMPRPELFKSNEDYYSTLFHELVHSTAHSSRLRRIDNTKSVSFNSSTYSKEELVAEMGSAFLCGSCRIVDKTIENSAAYIGAWMRRLRNDKTLIVKAAAQAQKATDYINGITFPVDKDE